ncbi:MAG: hypothetical protein IPG74_07185 [Flavobacteriales bacterium]|nr:hypothetical protein [Flavobacteriales bacterium]MBK9193749.1 hypothetical protein [Flavobacteriales bacterium]
MRHPLLVASAFLLTSSLRAQVPTWADDVSCIVYSHCTTCHHDGGAGHFSLMTYVDAYNKRSDMQLLTSARIMPPWPPDEDYRSLAHERSLTQDEIDIIGAWVQGSAPEGIPGNAPAPPVYLNEVVIDQPDISVIMDDYVIPPSTADLYRCFVMPSNTSVDQFITGLEVIPGNTSMVHHALVFQDTSGVAQQLDNADPAPGYTNFGGIGVDDAKLIGIWVPGSSPYFTPPGFGINLAAGADIVIQIHYPATSSAELDSTRINIQLDPGPLRGLAIDPLLEHFYTLTDGPLIIPPDQIKTFHSEFTVPLQGIITAIGPHAHKVCTSMKAFATLPNNDTIPLIDIPYWDFEWQGLYEFRKPIFLPLNSVLHGEATYNNTITNPNNPQDTATQWVFLGEATSDEMMLFYFAWAFGFPFDTLTVIDNSTHADHHLNCTTDFNIGMQETLTNADVDVWPTLVTDRINVQATAGREVRLLDANGRTAKSHRYAGGLTALGVEGLARGTYIAEVRDAHGQVMTRIPVVLQ